MTLNGKKVVGVKATPELVSLLSECIVQCDSTTTTTIDTVCKSPNVVALASAPLSVPEALPLLKSRSDDDVIPFQVIRAMYSVMRQSGRGVSSVTKLDAALAQTRLMYSSPPPATDKDAEEQKRFQKRMERLRLRAEEARYMKLTQNLDNTVEDDVTTKSMTYAASVGLNMIVAPLSFGVFMYFFAGAMFGWIVGDDGREPLPHETDIKSVITGVVSGVFMLFVECLLFVIRTHSFDDGMRKKKKRKTTVSPFGPSALRETPKARQPRQLTK